MIYLVDGQDHQPQTKTSKVTKSLTAKRAFMQEEFFVKYISEHNVLGTP